MVGIICLPGWNRVNFGDQKRMSEGGLSMKNLFIHIFDKGTMMTSKSAVAVKIPVETKKEQKKNDPGAEAALRADLAKFLMNKTVSVDKSSKSGDKTRWFSPFVKI